MKIPETLEDITLEWFNAIFNTHGIKVHGFTFGGEMSHGRGMMGSLEEVELEISRPQSMSSKKPSTEKLDIVLKTLPRDEFRRAYAANDGFCSREVSVYTEIFRAWDEFLDSRQVPKEDRFRHPICYYGAEEGSRDTYRYILVLENLLEKKKGNDQFHLWESGFFEPLPLTAASTVIREIARLHATGIAFKKQHEEDVEYMKSFPKLNHIVSPYFQMMWNNGFEVTKTTIKESYAPDAIPEGLFEQLDKLQGEESQKLLLKWFTDASMFIGHDQATICHHDLHSNNLVLSSDFSKTILFDYQATCVFNPMKDLSFFLILNCDSDLAITNLRVALQLYHDEFERTMKACKFDYKYSLEKIAQDYERFHAFSITHIITGAPFWVAGQGCTEQSKKRFAMAIVEAFKKGSLKFPVDLS